MEDQLELNALFNLYYELYCRNETPFTGQNSDIQGSASGYSITQPVPRMFVIKIVVGE